MNNKQVVLAMSGGVDSSVAAYLLKEKGYSVIGVTLKIWPKSFCGMQGPRSCCSQESIKDALSVCAKLDIPHYVLDCEKQFKKEVIDYFLKSYNKGLTPNPCIICNEKIKFPVLIRKAKETDSSSIATGHHARCVLDKINNRFLIKEGKDKKKDQSYVLFGLTQDALSRLLLPVGDFNKEKIRKIARELKLRVHNKKESQEICFIHDNDLEKFLKEHLAKSIKPGYIKHKNGKILGKHDGTCFFTTGQRKGLRIPFGRPIYVMDINNRTGEVVVGDYEDTLKTNLVAKDINWIRRTDNIKKSLNVSVKIRYKHPKAEANLKILSPSRCEVNFKRPQSSPTPGQAVVFYERDTVIGGGWIQKR